MDRFDELQAFVHTCDAGSLSGAARVLGRSAASVTRAVAALEARVGAELLRRTTRSLRITEAGERYLEVARRVLAELDEADTTTRAGHTAPRGLLTLTAPVSFGSRHVAPVVHAYLARFPEVQARLLLLDRVVSIVEEGIDVAVRIAHLPDSALLATAVGTVRRVCCASPAYLARHGVPEQPTDLSRHRCLSFASLTPSDSWSFAGRQVRVRPVLAVNAAQAAVDAAVAGLGITWVLSYQVEEALAAGALVPILEAFAPPPLPVHLVYPATSTSSAKVRAFLDLAAPLLGRALGSIPSTSRRR